MLLHNSKRALYPILLVVMSVVTLFLPIGAHASPVKDAYHQVMPQFDNFLVAIDALDQVLWTGTSFSQQQVWETLLHSAIAANNKQLEASAQQALIDFGMTEQQMKALYRLDPTVYEEDYLAVLTFAQRSAVLPTKVNANDINKLREYYSTIEVTELAMINAYASMFNVLYGTGYVSQNTEPVFANFSPQLVSLKQEKILSAIGWRDRHFFESPLLVLDLSLPFVDLDGVMLEEPHSFSLGELWEMFVVGQTVSDCKHCITHGAFGMHLALRDHQDIINAYKYDGTGNYTAREKARLDFVQNALRQPSTITEAHRTALSDHYSELEIQHILGISSFMGMLSSYMQITACITDDESANFARYLLGPEGFEIGRHVGPRDEQRRMHPISLYRITPNDEGIERTQIFSGQVMRKVWSESKFPTVSGPVTHAFLQILLFVGFIIGCLKINAK